MIKATLALHPKRCEINSNKNFLKRDFLPCNQSLNYRFMKQNKLLNDIQVKTGIFNLSAVNERLDFILAIIYWLL